MIDDSLTYTEEEAERAARLYLRGKLPRMRAFIEEAYRQGWKAARCEPESGEDSAFF